MRKTSVIDFKKLFRHPVALAILAVGGGALGGFVQRATIPTVFAQAEPRVIQASRVELVNSAGKRVGILGVDENGGIGLVFFDPHGKKRAEFGIGRGESPRLDINGPEGDSLLSLDLGQHFKPRLMMSDHDFNGRVYLGVAEPDAPSPDWKYDAWVLRFRGDRGQPLATIGMTTGGVGGVTVLDQAGRRWQTPLKE